MTQIHKDAKPVHLLHNLSAEVAQASMFFVASSRVADVVVSVVTKRHIDYAAMFELFKQPYVFSYGITVLDTPENGLLALCFEAKDVARRLCEANAIAVCLDYLVDLCEQPVCLCRSGFVGFFVALSLREISHHD